MSFDSQSTFETSWIHGVLGTTPKPEETGVLGFASITTDTRQVRGGELFVALQGDKHDAHDFIPQALKSGARGILARSEWLEQNRSELRKIESSAIFFGVKDPLQGFRALAAAWRKRFHIPVILVAGSVGKTTTKELLASLLSGHYSAVLKTEGSQNGYVGIPITLLNLREHHRAAVIEVGIDEVGAMAKHVPLVSPNLSVLTQLGPEHLEKLIDLQTVTREETQSLIETHQQGGTVVFQLTDPHVTAKDSPWKKYCDRQTEPTPRVWATWIDKTTELKPEMEAHVIRHGFPVLVARWGAGRVAKAGAPSPHSNTVEFLVRGGEQDGSAFSLPCPLPGEHNVHNLALAVAVGLALKMNPVEMARGLGKFQSAPGRSEKRELKNGLTVYCDFYNSNPTSLEAGLRLVRDDIKPSAQKWAYLGDMLELGPQELEFHRAMAEPILKAGIHHLTLVGSRMQALADRLKELSFTGSIQTFASSSDLAHWIQNLTLQDRDRQLPHSQDVVLIKGSRSVKMEKVFDAMTAIFGALT